MQTFLPDPKFTYAAAVLDRQRLGKQRIEAFQILEALAGLRPNWKHHPAVIMWTGCEVTLAKYGIAICNEWANRGYEDNMRERFIDFMQDGLYQGQFQPGRNDGIPWWLGVNGFHLSHRSVLLRKNPEHYRQYWPDVPDTLEYTWPEPRDPIPFEPLRHLDWVSWD